MNEAAATTKAMLEATNAAIEDLEVDKLQNIEAAAVEDAIKDVKTFVYGKCKTLYIR